MRCASRRLFWKGFASRVVSKSFWFADNVCQSIRPSDGCGPHVASKRSMPCRQHAYSIHMHMLQPESFVVRKKAPTCTDQALPRKLSMSCAQPQQQATTQRKQEVCWQLPCCFSQSSQSAVIHVPKL